MWPSHKNVVTCFILHIAHWLNNIISCLVIYNLKTTNFLSKLYCLHINWTFQISYCDSEIMNNIFKKYLFVSNNWVLNIVCIINNKVYQHFAAFNIKWDNIMDVIKNILRFMFIIVTMLSYVIITYFKVLRRVYWNLK